MKFNICACLLISLIAGSVATADITDARITEIWVGRSGPDGTQDWIEVTNTGDTAIDTGQLLYDDSNPMVMSGGILQSVNLGPGESAVFLLDAVADNQTDFPNAGAEFFAVWGMFDPATMDLGVTGGGGGLGQGGDSANLLDPTSGALIDSFDYGSAGTVNTLERTGEGFSDFRESVAGENGAYESELFNDEDTGMTAVDDAGMPVILVGSPGIFKGFATTLLGDVNCDGVVNLLDVAPFVDLISSAGFSEKADINMDGAVNLLDVDPFVTLLSGG